MNTIIENKTKVIEKFEGLNNIHFDYKFKKYLIELDWIKKGFRLVKWGKTHKTGTKGTFKKASTKDLEERLEKLKIELKQK